MSTRLLEISRFSPRIMRDVYTAARDPALRRGISKALGKTEEVVYQNLADSLEQLEIERKGLLFLLPKTGGDVELSITILAHLLDTSPADLLDLHSDYLERGRRVNSKKEAIFNMLKISHEVEIPDILIDLSNLLKTSHEEIGEKLISLAQKLEEEESVGCYIKNSEIRNPNSQAVLFAKSTGLTIRDLKIRHPLFFRDISINDSPVPKPQLAPKPYQQRVATAVLTS